MADKTVILTTAVRCFLVNGTSWNPREGEGLNCFHEESNSWGIFSIKVCTSDSKIIGYLTCGNFPNNEISYTKVLQSLWR